MKYTVEEIIELAKEVETTDLIDWGGVNIEQDRIYQIIGTQVHELYSNPQYQEDHEAILLATIIKLVVENFILNIKLERGYD